jgi:hypothetical protein
MLRQNIDFFAVFFIALVILASSEARRWHFRDGADVVRFDDAILLDGCETTRQVLSGINAILH